MKLKTYINYSGGKILGRKKSYKNKKNANNKKYNLKWIFLITIWTFILAIFFSIISANLLRNLDILFSSMILILIVLIGVIFDTVGIAVASANEKPFHSMASNKIYHARYAVRLVRNAVVVSNFCNDVIGDIAGIISGATGTMIILKLISNYGFIKGTIPSIIMSALISSLTVGGKAVGKEFAMNQSDKIILFVARIIMFFDIRLGITIIPEIKSK